MPPSDIETFIERWIASGGAEIANFQTFASELTDVLGVERPKPAKEDGQNDDYRFERPVSFAHTNRQRRGRIDLYKSSCFVLEAKQGSRSEEPNKDQLALLTEEEAPRRAGHGRRGGKRFDDAMMKARAQADEYARAISREDGWPPFLLVCDVGHVIEVYADFSGQGQGYNQFPDGARYRIYLDDLREEEVREHLRKIWEDPLSLDPALVSAKVTRDIAAHLAELGKSFEGQGHDSEAVARFLMRCLFCMFAEDVELIPKGSFTGLLKKIRGRPEHAAPSLQGLWETMNAGGFSQLLMQDLKRFNGGLFREADALPLSNVQLGLLIEAAEADWKQVEPAIFGTLLERALDKRQRHKLGAHYTPRAYVERLVTPTVMEPLRGDWRNIQASVQRLTADGKEDEALKLVRMFHQKLCEVRVLDPACGSGNFLYVALEMMKRLEGEVVTLMQELGDDQGALGLSGHTVDPHQFLGIELNPWAANVAELVLWIGYLQWHFRTYGRAATAEPVLKDFRNIECRDAVLDWTDRSPRMDAEGKPVTRWDGVTTMRHPVTAEEVPDPDARVQVYDYAGAKAATWPAAEFIVGNPPFIGNKRMRDSLGDGYVEALRAAYPKVPQSADLVMFWWDKAALAARAWDAKGETGTRRFGLITTNSLRQTFNRRVLEPHLNDAKKPLSLLFAIPDHPWVDTQFGAAVRIAMTVGAVGNRAGRLLTLASEWKEKDEAEGREVSFEANVGKIFANLRIGADVASAKLLASNLDLAFQGVTPLGEGFRISQNSMRNNQSAVSAGVIRPYLNGKQLLGGVSPGSIIDFFGLDESEARSRFPALFQKICDEVKPSRDEQKRLAYREKYWLFAEPRINFRNAAKGIKQFIATCRTAKHRLFVLLDSEILPDAKIVAICLDGADSLSILSSRHHVTWSISAGAWLGVGNDANYNHAQCFNTFPFPASTPVQTALLRDLGEELDAHRKRQQATHPKLTLTQMYNVLEKLRAGEVIEGRDKEIHEQGLVSLLKDIHDRIDAAVADAYGWPVDLSEEETLHRLVALNKERAAEEAQGHIRWLRPDYQNPEGKTAEAKGEQTAMDVGPADKAAKAPWPKTLPDQIAAVREALEEMGEASPEQIARRFARARTKTVLPLLDSLAALGQAEIVEDGRYAA